MGAGVTAGTPADGLPARSRGVIALLEENCTVCMLCARECPDWCIYIESHQEPVPGAEYGGAGDPARAPAGRGRQRVRNVLDRFAIDFSLCMYCGICVEACPYDALFWSPEFSYAETDIAALTHEQGRLREWMWTRAAAARARRGAAAAAGLRPRIRAGAQQILKPALVPV